MPGQCREEPIVAQQLSELVAEVGLKRLVGSSHVLYDFHAAIYDADEVFDVVARREVAMAASVKRLELGGQEARRRNQRDLQPSRECDLE